MKYIIVLGDGMADEPIATLGGKTPLQVAKTPTMDFLAKNGKLGILETVPNGFHPGSEIANLSVLGYDVTKVFEGRGSLEAASMGIEILQDEMAMRCNLICIEDGKIKNHSAGHISNEEALELINYLQQELGDDRISFYPGISYRHLLKIKNADKRILCTPPHDVPGTPYKDVLIKHQIEEASETATLINDLILKSQELLSKHPINQKRILEGKDPANSIWPWSPGYKPSMQKLSDLYGISKGVVISAVDLIKGIGVYAGLEPIDVDGATGLYNTNYEGKINAAIDALRGDADFVFLHIEASDEAGHEGDVELKVKTIEYLDSRVLKPLINALGSINDDVAIALLPDHPTPCRLRTHTSNPVPFLIYHKGIEADDVDQFNEISAQRGGFKLIKQDAFIRNLIVKK
ncbi:MAG: cofactor-independent phosphoglycerate mutase [Muribaculaceae bacterium]|nr:cofactor-independent phosphoglycerate mutase [Muribaculaceae bacterium]